MLKDSQTNNTPPLPNSLSVSSTIEVDKVLEFIDQSIPGFCPYYQTIKDSDRENRISDFLVHHFQLCKDEQYGGFFPCDFRKNPTQELTGKETDIGVFVLTRGKKPMPIIEFEAKRFSESSSNEQYVYGERGGIERFKRGHHSSHLKVCGLFGYVQSRTLAEWQTRVNDWLHHLAQYNADISIDWSGNEALQSVASFDYVNKCLSVHKRVTPYEKISLWHYFIDLTR